MILGGLKQLGGGHVQRTREAIDVHEPKVPLAPLDAADICAVKVSPFRPSDEGT